MADIVKLHRSVRPSSQWQVWAGCVRCNNFVDRNLTLSVCGHSSVALNHMTNRVNLTSAFRISARS